ncbi:MAG: heme exporter protein CcmD [Sphingomonadales bacterium]|nr:heme exporter protein CcmD [Sphingomonadales bacterium]
MSGQWIYVASAYGVTALATLLLTGWAWRSMRGAERRVERLRDRP